MRRALACVSQQLDVGLCYSNVLVPEQLLDAFDWYPRRGPDVTLGACGLGFAGFRFTHQRLAKVMRSSLRGRSAAMQPIVDLGTSDVTAVGGARPNFWTGRRF